MRIPHARLHPAALMLSLVLLSSLAVDGWAATAAPSVTSASSPAPGNPVPAGGLTLDQALATALARHPLIDAARLEVDAYSGAVRQASAWRNPDLSLEQEDVGRDTRTTTVQLSQTFELGGKRAARRGLAERDRDLSVTDLNLRLVDIRATVIQAWFDLLIAQERIAVTEQSLAIAADGTAAATRRVAAGKVSPTEATRARVEESVARIELRQAVADRAAATQMLAVAMAVPPETITGIDGRAEALPQLPDPGLLEQRIARSPMLVRAGQQTERARAVYEIERSRAVPDLTLAVGNARAGDIDRNQLVLGLSFPLPVFDRNEGARTEALRRLEASRHEAQARQQRLRAEVLRNREQVIAGVNEARTLQEDVLPGARSAWEAASRGFDLGKFSFLEVLDAQRTWLLARGRYLDLLARVHRDAAELDRQLGLSANEARAAAGQQP